MVLKNKYKHAYFQRYTCFLTLHNHLGSPFIIFTSTKHASSTSKIFLVFFLLSSFAEYTRYFSCIGCRTFWLCWCSVWFSWYFWLQNYRWRTRAVSPPEQLSTASYCCCCQDPSTIKSQRKHLKEKWILWFVLKFSSPLSRKFSS